MLRALRAAISLRLCNEVHCSRGRLGLVCLFTWSTADATQTRQCDGYRGGLPIGWEEAQPAPGEPQGTRANRPLLDRDTASAIRRLAGSSETAAGGAWGPRRRRAVYGQRERAAGLLGCWAVDGQAHAHAHALFTLYVARPRTSHADVRPAPSDSSAAGERCCRCHHIPPVAPMDAIPALQRGNTFTSSTAAGQTACNRLQEPRSA